MKGKIWKLPGNYTKILKGFHVIFVAISFGGLLAIETILYQKLSFEYLTLESHLDFAIYEINNELIYYSFLGLIASVLIYGLYTNWGFLKYYWIIIKWILLLLFSIIYISFFSQSINALTSFSDSGLHLNAAKADYEKLLSDTVLFNIVLILILFTIFLISTLKPFGKRNTDFLSEYKYGRLSVIAIVFITLLFAVMGSSNINKLRNMDINNPILNNLEDGNYKGKFIGGGGDYSVIVEITDHEIKNIHFKTTRKSKYIRFAEPVIQRIIISQRVNVDAITGATTTSKCIMKSVENALNVSDN